MNNFIELADHGQDSGLDIYYRAYLVGGTDAYFEVARPCLDPAMPYQIYSYPDYRSKLSKAILGLDVYTIAQLIDPDLAAKDEDGYPQLTADQISQIQDLRADLVAGVKELND